MVKISIVGVMLSLVASCCTVQHPEAKRSCVSYCGMLFEGTPNGSMSCSQLQTAEDTTLAAYDAKLRAEDQRFCRANACKAIFGWQVETDDAVIATSNGSDFYLGASTCESKTMVLMANQDWRHGSYPHELAHVVQDCSPPNDWEETPHEHDMGSGHAGWTEHNVYKTIDSIRHGE